MDCTDLHWMYKETLRRLDTLHARVREGKSLQEAAEFARYIYWSKIPKILKRYPQPEPLKIDGHLIEKRAQELLGDVQDQWQRNPKDFQLLDSAFEQILKKLTALEAGNAALLKRAGRKNVKNRHPAISVVTSSVVPTEKGVNEATG
jgi:hypothetical protein